MNCRQAEPQIFAERDGALDDLQRAALAQHLAECAVCRRLREGFTVAIASWRTSAQQTQVPDAELEWQKLRREIRGGAGSTTTAAARGARMAWLAVPLAGAALAAVVFYVSPEVASPREPVPTGQTIAKATAENPSTVVFVDDKSGWTFVVAGDDAHRG